MSGLPKEWTKTTVGELADSIQYGHTASSTSEQVGPRFLRITDIQENRVDWDTVPFCQIPQSQIPKYRLAKGDLVFARTGATVGKSFLIQTEIPESIFASYLIRVRVTKAIEARYLYYFFQSSDYWHQISDSSSGIGQPNVNGTKLAAITLPIAPLPEQRRIVARIEELFSRLDAGVAALRHAKAQLQRYRQSVLAAAVTGELTKCGDFSLLPLASLIEGLGQGWSPKCDLNRAPREDEWAIIKTTAVQSMRYDDSEAKPLPPNLRPRPGIEIQAGDFLMTRKGPRQRAGVTCFVPSTRHRLMICDTVYRFRCIRHLVQPKYLELALNSSRIVKEIDKLKSGISESGVSLTHDKIGGVIIPVPALSEQHQIVAEVEARTTAIDHLEAELDRQITRANRLRQSTLGSAFEGNL